MEHCLKKRLTFKVQYPSVLLLPIGSFPWRCISVKGSNIVLLDSLGLIKPKLLQMVEKVDELDTVLQ